MCRDLICVVNDKDVIRPYAHHPGQSILGQKCTQVVVSDPAVLPATVGEVVEEHVQNFVTDVIICTIEEKLEKTGEKKMPQKWVILHKETDLSEVNSLLKGPILTQPHLVMFMTVTRLLL